jgi:hypothetical protein
VHRGDLLTDLPALAAEAPADATLVVYHSAVLAYVSPAGRQQFAATVRGLGAVWLSSEGPGVVPGLPIPPYQGAIRARPRRQPAAGPGRRARNLAALAWVKAS